MNKNIRWKVITIVAVLVVFAGVGVYPILASAYHLPSPSWLQQKQIRQPAPHFTKPRYEQMSAPVGWSGWPG